MRAVVLIAVLACTAVAVAAIDSSKGSRSLHSRLHAKVKVASDSVSDSEVAAAVETVAAKGLSRIARSLAGYDAFEHQETAHAPALVGGTFAAGSSVDRKPLSLPLPDGTSKTTDDRFMAFGNSELAFGEMTAMAGDYFGVKAAKNIVCDSSEAISLTTGSIPARPANERPTRYTTAFNDFA